MNIDDKLKKAQNEAYSTARSASNLAAKSEEKKKQVEMIKEML